MPLPKRMVHRTSGIDLKVPVKVAALLKASPSDADDTGSVSQDDGDDSVDLEESSSSDDDSSAPPPKTMSHCTSGVNCLIPQDEIAVPPPPQPSNAREDSDNMIEPPTNESLGSEKKVKSE